MKKSIRAGGVIILLMGVLAALHYAYLYASGVTACPMISGGSVIIPLTILLLLSSGYALYRFSAHITSPARHHAITHRIREQVDTSAYVLLCPVCNARQIEDKHYQLCLSCKQQFSKEIQRVRVQCYRARKAGTLATLTPAQWIQTLQAFRFTCAYCQDKPYEVLEHIIPVSKGGATSQENCIPACFQCNASKQAIHPEK